MSAFEIVDDAEQKPKRSRLSEVKGETQSADGQLAEQFAKLIFATFSQRAVSIFSAIFTLAGLALVWWTWMSILPNPSILQLVGAALFSVFLLALEWVRRR